ncbi:MAG: tocopherol cyclase family protein [Oscillospiraceae bacterium]|nr:tocopherol cyclase family protein [Oscillospiraceae bacterium]
MQKKEYFKGWYFKCSNENKTIAFIPAFHRNLHQETASFQMITDDTAFNIPFQSLQYQENPLVVKIGENVFSENGIRLHIKNNKLSANGVLRFSGLSPIQYDIMGPFKFVPFMQCRHSVYSMRHRIDGQLTVNGQQYVFNNGTGYIEGDCGSSFPKEYIWTQCHFNNGSLMLSVADIPLFEFHFTGIIGVVLINGKEHRIATYLGAKVKHIGKYSVTVKQGDYQLTAKLLKKNSQPLSAPNHGLMNRTIHESASCKACYQFLYKDKVLFEFNSDRASFEFEYK